MIGGVRMDKEKIINAVELDKTERDEREELIKTSSYTQAYLGGWVILVLLMIIRWIAGEDFTGDLIMILMGQMSFMTFYLYINNKENKLSLYMFITTTLIFLIGTYKTLVFYGII